MRLPSAQPATLLLAWGMLLLALLHESGLRVSAGALAICAISLLIDRRRVGALLRRSRWLLLATLFAFGWLTPGMPVPGLPGATGDGLSQAFEQVARLLISIAMTALLLSRLKFPELLTALHGVALPLRWLGFDIDRGLLRLALVLEELDRPRRTTGALSLLDESIVIDAGDEPIRIAGGHYGLVDVGLLFAVLCVVLLVQRA